MKNQTFISFMVLLLLASLSFIGCGSDGGGGSSQDTQALTENDFANDPSLRADPEGGVIVQFLEPPDSEKPENDTGEIGVDVIPMTYKRDLNHTYCWDDDDEDSEHFMILLDSNDVEILRLGANEDCVTAFVDAGSYTMIIHHDARIETIHTIFIVPESGLVANNKDSIPEGILERAGRVLSNILEELESSIIQTTNAQTVADNINTLIMTNSCGGCDLIGANFCCGANLAGANLVQANLSGANLVQANLAGANLTFANLAVANISFANLSEANLLGANLAGADLTLVTWCDGSLCAAFSTGICETGTRFRNNCDGTISDANTVLVWEKKTGIFDDTIFCECDGDCDTDCPDPHDVNNKYTWSSTGVDPDVTVFTDFLDKLNNSCNNDPSVDCSLGGNAACMNASVVDCCGFACHRDWRLPHLDATCLSTVDPPRGRGEFEGLLDCSFGLPCIDPIFGPTAPFVYWSDTVSIHINPVGGILATDFNFNVSTLLSLPRDFPVHVRAVRP